MNRPTHLYEKSLGHWPGANTQHVTWSACFLQWKFLKLKSKYGYFCIVILVQLEQNESIHVSHLWVFLCKWTITLVSSSNTKISHAFWVPCWVFTLLHINHRGPLPWHGQYSQNALYFSQWMQNILWLDMEGIMMSSSCLHASSSQKTTCIYWGKCMVFCDWTH